MLCAARAAGTTCKRFTFRERDLAIQAYPQKPPILNTYAILTLIDGILNILLAVGCGGYFCFIGLATVGLGLLCLPLAAYPLVLGILEIIQYNALNKTPPTRRDVPSWLAIMQIIGMMFSNPLAMAAGIVGLVAGNDADVKAYMSGQGPEAPQPF